MTATVADAVWPWTRTDTTAVPVRIPFTRPDHSSETTSGALLLQISPSPAMGVPLASFGVAMSWNSAPSSTSTSVTFSSTEATSPGAAPCTTTATSALRPPALAVMVVVPMATACTSPAALTVATLSALLLHAIVCPPSSAPATFRATAASWTASPTVSCGSGVVISTDATASSGLSTTSGMLALRLPADAVIVASPTATACSSPVALTVATPCLPVVALHDLQEHASART